MLMTPLYSISPEKELAPAEGEKKNTGTEEFV